ncbi:MAG: ATP-dependent RNA helicase HrpA [Phycisphaerales bacterium]|nr:ATP-dependent RNA helicase HrpA [Phycisphaerales bacterium]
MIGDRRGVMSRLHRAVELLRRGKPADRLVAQAAEEIERSVVRVTARRARLPAPEYPPGLPVVEQRAVIKAAIAARQVVVVCGETGSGKTTQLPKICLELGRGVSGLIGHTQPRRIAARSVAARIAEELAMPLGAAVGYKVRFGDRTSPDGYIKLMTDGILLAETQGDRWLEQYDTLIIDEAHERSLNIDFLLGYLRQLLPRRPDLKVIITSATIDPERFAKHFADERGPAPIVEVSGRTYPVEVRYRPLAAQEEGEEDRDLERGVLEAIDELAGVDPTTHGDVLVFLSGEREIREMAEALRKHHPPQTQILPLYARLSAEEQMRVFQPHPFRRIVLATNVAETSLTVPGIRYVVDPGAARISRYSARTKVQGLPIEPVSQASANQRAGRCGRVAEGICIRLYTEQDYQNRPLFTEPEILRSNLAAVILQMKALRLAAIEQFPFVEPPEPRMIRDGYDTLRELGAVDEAGELTAIGRSLARLPIDPRLGRMILAGEKEGCLAEVLVIASALSVQDPRDRPLEKQGEADAKHEQFRDERSDFIAFLKLWDFFHDRQRHLSGSKLRKSCKENFLSFVRLREWHDVHQQLHAVLGEMGLRFNRERATYDAIHRALLAGLLSNVGKRGENKHGLGDYDAARGSGFGIHPGSGLFKRGPKWLMSGEIVRTTRVYARAVAAIEPEWIEELGAHLLKRHVFEPHWRRDRAQAMAYEKVTMLGLEIVAKRSILLARVDPKMARELFIHHALVEGEYATDAPFMAHNRGLIAEVKRSEAKVRRRDLLADQQQRFDFFDRRLPAEITDGRKFERWREDAERRDPRLLHMSLRDLLAADESAEVVKFPDEVAAFGERLRIDYRFEPGAADDGATLTVPLAVLGQLDAASVERAVPGLAEEKARAMVRALPKSIRKYVSEEMLREAEREAKNEDGPASRAIGLALQRRLGIQVPWELWDGPSIPEHLRMNFRVVDERGRPLATGRDIGKLRRDLGDRIRRGFLAIKDPRWTRERMEDWDVGDLPEVIQISVQGAMLSAYPALHEEDGRVALRLFDTANTAAVAMRQGLKRLLVVRAADDFRLLLTGRPEMERIVARYATIGPKEELRRDLEGLIADRAFLASTAGGVPVDAAGVRTQGEFQARLKAGRARIPDVARSVLGMVDQLLGAYHTAAVRVSSVSGAAASNAAADMRMQLGYLMPRRFLVRTPPEWLAQLPRYLRAIEVRAERLSGSGAERDARRMAELTPLWWNYINAAGTLGEGEAAPPALVRYRWLLEELRVSLFAQELGTAVPVSVKRLWDEWARVQGRVSA